jgi:hypothetical protein
MPPLKQPYLLTYLRFNSSSSLLTFPQYNTSPTSYSHSFTLKSQTLQPSSPPDPVVRQYLPRWHHPLHWTCRVRLLVAEVLQKWPRPNNPGCPIASLLGGGSPAPRGAECLQAGVTNARISANVFSPSALLKWPCLVLFCTCPVLLRFRRALLAHTHPPYLAGQNFRRVALLRLFSLSLRRCLCLPRAYQATNELCLEPCCVQTKLLD